MHRRATLALAIAAAVAGCGGGEKASKPLPAGPAAMTLASPAFRDGGAIPVRFTCDGAGTSPPLRWSRPPARTRSLALLVEDPDAGRFVHWTVLDLPARTRGLREGAVPPGAVQLKNGFGDRGWGPPCPPEGDPAHEYDFAVYALRRPLALGAGASPDEVRQGIARDVLARGLLRGRFGR